MSTALVDQPVPRTSFTPPNSPPLDFDTIRPSSAPIPNKHLPFCPPGPSPGAAQQTPTPPASPPTKHTGLQARSVLYPVDRYPKISEAPPIFSIDASVLAEAIDELASQLFPDPKLVFPWLHGLHAENQVQLAFFIARRKALRNTPKCLRSITIVKVGGDLSKSRLKGTISGDEVLDPRNGKDAVFLDIDPKDGFSVRNFQIQATKMATISDIVIYGDEDTSSEEIRSLAQKFAFAQGTWRVKSNGSDYHAPTFNTFVLSSPFKDIEARYPDLIAIDSHGHVTGKVMDFSQWERLEMCKMSRASEIARNVWLGPTPDSILCPPEDHPTFDVFIDTNDLAQPPEPSTLRRIEELSYTSPQHLEFPSSGSIMPEAQDNMGSDPVTLMCRWIHRIANVQGGQSDAGDEDGDSDGDIQMQPQISRSRKVLIHCTDGYTESTLLALAYYMYAEQIPAHEAWLRLHCERGRNFFAYPSDVALLISLERCLVPRLRPRPGKGPVKDEESSWLSRIDGSLPSRILPYMYLGNLGHANNPDLLKAMGIKRILSVGEPANWTQSQVDSWGAQNLLFIDRVQDNGVDSLMKDFERCLKFIGKGKSDQSATLVHCRVGVSRSATICIAEVMSSLAMSFPRAYCFVRARRLNVIIQPHLKFAYELLKWDETCQQRRGEIVRRELEWATIAREIAAMNKPYASR